jgi:hypothetical protein
MKKMMSLAAMFAVLAYASPASAELKLGGDAGMRARMEFNDSKSAGVEQNGTENSSAAFRVRLNGAADMGDGYFFKAMLSTEQNTASTTFGGGWFDTDDDGAGIEVSQFYFGRMMQDSHWMLGRVPLGSFNNPIYDLTYFAVPTALTTAVDTPVDTWLNDRSYAINYGSKIGPGMADVSLVMTDNASDGESGAEGDGIFGDGYLLNLTYKVNVGNVTVTPQALIALTDITNSAVAYSSASPNTFGANMTIPAGDAKIGLSGFYTACDDSKAVSAQSNVISGQGADYSGYLFRVKGEMGNAMVFVDYNATEDKTVGNVADYDNIFVRASYKFKVHESATGSFSLIPTLRWRHSEKDMATGTDTETEQLRAELYAMVTF